METGGPECKLTRRSRSCRPVPGSWCNRCPRMGTPKEPIPTHGTHQTHDRKTEPKNNRKSTVAERAPVSTARPSTAHINTAQLHQPARTRFIQQRARTHPHTRAPSKTVGIIMRQVKHGSIPSPCHAPRPPPNTFRAHYPSRFQRTHTPTHPRPARECVARYNEDGDHEVDPYKMEPGLPDPDDHRDVLEGHVVPLQHVLVTRRA